MTLRTFPFLVVVLGSVAGETLAAGWKAGVARVVITPSESIWMAGYAARNRPSEGVRTQLYVKALALRDDTGKNTVIVSSDIIGFRRELADRIAARCQKQFGLAQERLLLNRPRCKVYREDRACIAIHGFYRKYHDCTVFIH
jgi:hypothetical protein